MDGTRDDSVWNDNEEDRYVKNEWKDDEGTDCGNGDRWH